MLAWIYFAAAYLSLVIINGILAFMLTPGKWLETREFWDGFFNPTYWPSLVQRTGIVLLMATAFMAFAALRAKPEARPRLLRYLGLWLVAGALISYAGYRWWEAALPESVRALFAADDPGSLAALVDTRSFLLWALAITLVVGAVFFLGLPRVVPIATALVVMVSSFAFFAGYERLREGVRKPFLIHDYMFSNGLLVEDIATLDEEGILSRAGWAAHEAGDSLEEQGRAVFRAQCSACHTLDGYQAIRPRVDPDFIEANLFVLRDQGSAFIPGERVDKTELDYPYMPPFVGTEEEMEALAAYLTSLVTPPDQVATKGVAP
jgi:mono/diheme cytochrome c family protein